MKIQLGTWTIRTAASLKKKILEGHDDKNIFYWQCVGIYSTRICGIVFYRNKEHDWY